jgi:putative salt-induced outer membrane protein YdiY
MPDLKSFIIACLGFFIVVPSSQPAIAQIVNVAAEANQDVREGASLKLEASWDRYLGNSDISLFSGTALGYYRHTRHLYLVIFKRDFNQEEQNTITDSSFQHGRYRYHISPRLSFEIFAQNDKDTKRRLAQRTVFGAGPRFRLFKGDEQRLFFGVAPMYEKEVYDNAGYPSEDDENYREHTRLSTYLTWSLNLEPNLDLAHVVYFQPLLQDMQDQRLLNETSLYLHFNDRFALKLTATVSYNSEPPVGVERTDHQYEQSLVISL